jgi:NitT/TauT family transport system ATP-binding protein
MESSADALIDVRNVTVRFDRRDPEPVIDDVSLQIRRGELVALIGPSGCGKSTLLNMAAGLVRPTEGEILMADKATVAYVFQRPRLLPWRNVMSNVEYGLQARGASRHAARQRAKEALELVNLKGWPSTPRCSCSTSPSARSTPSRAATCRRSCWASCAART